MDGETVSQSFIVAWLLISDDDCIPIEIAWLLAGAELTGPVEWVDESGSVAISSVELSHRSDA